MASHSEMREILVAIEAVRKELKTLLIEVDLSEPIFIHSPYVSRQAQTWHGLEIDLGRVLEHAKSYNSEVRESLYQRSLETSGIGALIAKNSGKPAPKPKAKAHPNLQKAYDFIKAQGPVKAALVCRKIDVESSTFRTHYVPKLKEMGVKNDGHGYYVPPEETAE